MYKILHRAIFYIGWLLSPFTFWNDAIVNIPIAYLAASLITGFIKMEFLSLVLWCYWITNAIGIVLMIIAGRNIFKDGGLVREGIKLAVTIVVYSGILILFNRFGFLKPGHLL